MRWVWLFCGAILGWVALQLYDYFTSAIHTGTFSWTGSLAELDHAAQIFLSLLALVALVYAKRQVEAALDAGMQERHISQASFLLELDTKWDSHSMEETKDVIMEEHEKIMAEIGGAFPTENDGAKMKRYQDRFTERLRELRTTDQDRYRTAKRMCNFFETVGLMVSLGYIDIELIDELFHGPIIQFDRTFRGHIAELQKETGVPNGLYEHALNLAVVVSRRR